MSEPTNKAMSANDATSGATLVGSPTEKVTPQPGEGRPEFVERCMTALEGEFPCSRRVLTAEQRKYQIHDHGSQASSPPSSAAGHVLARESTFP